MMMAYVIVASVALVTSAMLVGALASHRFRHLLLDRPGHRSLHATPMPRSGGVGIAAGIAAGVAAWGIASAGGLAPTWLGSIAVGWATVIAVSLLDDWRSLPAWLRLPCHLAACTLVAIATLEQSSAPSIVVAVLAMGWMTNLFNFMDGSDGLAGGMAIFGFGSYALASAGAGDQELALVATAAAAAAAGFLIYNFPPARIFMGDAGSISLGFLAGALGVAGYARHTWSLVFPMVVFAPFLLDATLTLGKRAVRGERLWEAHREHAYQRLNMLGLGHVRTSLLYYLAMATCAVAALTWPRTADQNTLTSVGIGLAASLIVAYFIVCRLWRTRSRRAA